MARKKKQLPILEKVTITDVAAEGKAIARVNDMVVFVPFVAPGDVVDIQLTRKKNSYAEGKPVYFHEYSAKRAEPFCEHFGVCGGCKWQHLPYEEQLYYKQKQVYDNLTRIGKVEMEEKLPILGSERTTFYRNKLEFTFSNKKWLTEEEIQSGASFDCMNGVGFHIPGMFDKVLDIHKCWLQDDISNKIRLCVKEYCLSHEGYPFFDLRNQEGFVRTLMIRTASTGDLMVVLVFFHEDVERREALLSHLAERFPEITSLMYVINGKCNDTITDQEVPLFFFYRATAGRRTLPRSSGSHFTLTEYICSYVLCNTAHYITFFRFVHAKSVFHMVRTGFFVAVRLLPVSGNILLFRENVQQLFCIHPSDGDFWTCHSYHHHQQ